MITSAPRSLRSLLRAAIPALTLALAAGCAGDTGDRCEKDSDCSSGLTCVAIASSSGYDGTCQPQNQGRDSGVDTATPDTGAPVDGAQDMSIDATTD